MDSSACIFNKLHTVLFLVFLSTFKKVLFSLKVFAPRFFFFPQPSHLMRLCTLETVHVKSHSKQWTKRQPPLELFHRVVSPIALLEPGSKKNEYVANKKKEKIRQHVLRGPH